MLSRYRLTIHLTYDEETNAGIDPIILEFETRWEDGATNIVADLLKAYPDWQYWRLQRQEWEDILSAYKGSEPQRSIG